jgi:hypothetical protein
MSLSNVYTRRGPAVRLKVASMPSQLVHSHTIEEQLKKFL